MRACKISDIECIYRVFYKVDKDLNPTEPAGEDFDEYYCANCEEYFEYAGNVEQHFAEQKVSV